MKRKPRPRAASIMTPAVIATVGLAGLFMSVAINGLIVFGTNTYGAPEIASTMGLVAFSLMLVVAAFECRDEHASILRSETLDNRNLNITAVVEVVLAILIAKGDFLPAFLGTTNAVWRTMADRRSSRRCAVRRLENREVDRPSSSAR